MNEATISIRIEGRAVEHRPQYGCTGNFQRVAPRVPGELVVRGFRRHERHITELARSLRNRGVEVTVFSEMPAPRTNQYRAELSDEGIRFVVRNFGGAR